jgi:hypothetical protein
LEQRRSWFASQLDLDPAKLVFVDETGASTNLARTHGRCRRGRRLRAAVPHGHYKTITLVAGLRLRGLATPKVYDRPMNAALFEGMGGKMSGSHPVARRYRRHGQFACPQGSAGRATDKIRRGRIAISAALQPVHEPIEKAFSKLKAYLRKIAERTVAGLMRALEACADIFKSAECTNYFVACGYDTT